jgi:outer membrane biosynthesis protein TonB
MLATACDLGVVLPEDLKLEFQTVEVGEATCDSLDKLIRDFRAAAEAGNTENSSEAAEGVPPKKTRRPAKKKADTGQQQPTEETTVTTATAKKPAKAAKKAKAAPSKKTAKKAVAKKAATQKARGGGGAATSGRITNETKIKVISKENPFTEGTTRGKMAAYVLGHTGETFGKMKSASKGLVDGWVIRQLAEKKLISIE